MERSTIIRKLMEDKGMKVSDVSKESGIAYSTVKSILENGIGKASYVNICKICESVGITADKLEDMIKNNKTKEPELSKEDYERIRKYKLISDYSPDGATVVDTVLDREYSIAEKLKENKKRIDELEKNIVNFPSYVSEDMTDYLAVEAAHNDAEINEDELEKMKSDIERLKKRKK